MTLSTVREIAAEPDAFGDARPPPALARVLGACALATLLDAVLWLFLYLRPAPLGAAFALDPAHYVFHAMFYAAWGHLLLALPFLLAARYRPRARWPLAAQIALTTPLLVLGAVDRECQRFLGMHVTPGWIATYGSVASTPGVIWEALASDLGGAWSSFAGVAMALSYPLFALTLGGWLAHASHASRAARRLSVGAAALLLVLPTVCWNIRGGHLRQRKVSPPLMLLVRELGRPAEPATEPGVRARAIADYRAHAQGLEGDSGWIFHDDEAYPLRKRYEGPASAPPHQPNLIVLQLETFRAKDMQSMNPALPGPAPTPFLDALARHPQSTFYRRYYASGVPTVHAFLALHASLLMHPSRSTPAEATTDHIDGFPGILRAHGYRTLHFTGSDPDWDSQRTWLDRWYDEVHFSPDDHERDRQVFRRARARIVEVARNQQPFLAYISSISNHVPFRNPEPDLALGPATDSVAALHNTMHYTDDVVRELYASLHDEPWFANTVWIVVGDHGFDLGERGETGGHTNLRHETTWVPLIVHGAARGLPAGASRCVASHIDVAPTVLEMVGIRDDHSFMGHALQGADCDRRETLVLNLGNFAYETPRYSLYQTAEGTRFVYAGDDLTQEHPLSDVPEALLRDAERLSSSYREVVRHVVDGDRIAPRPRKLIAGATVDDAHSSTAGTN